VIVSYCIDSENRKLSDASTKQKPYNEINNDYQYTLNDIKSLAEYSADLYSTTPTEREAYIKYYTDYYMQQFNQVRIPIFKIIYV
jgi:RNA-binding protein 5/10